MPQVVSPKHSSLSTRTKLLIGGAVFVLALAGGYFGNRYIIARDTKAVQQVLDNNQSLMLTKQYSSAQQDLQGVLPKTHTAVEKVAVLRYVAADYLIADNCTEAIKAYAKLEDAGEKTVETARQSAYCNGQLGNKAEARRLYELAISRVDSSQSPVKASDKSDLLAAIANLGAIK